MLQAASILRYTKWVFLLLMLALPLSKAVASISMGVLFVLAIVHYWQAERSHFKFIPLSLAFLYLLLAFSLIYTENIAGGFKELYRYNAFLLLPIIGWVFWKQFNKWHLSLLFTFIVGVSINASVVLLFYLLPDGAVIKITQTLGFLNIYEFTPNPVELHTGLYTPFIERIQLSNLIAVAALSSLYLFFRGFRKYWMLICLILLIITTMVLGGRGGQLGLLVGFFIFSLGALLKLGYPKIKVRFGALAANMAVLVLAIGILASPYIIYKTVPSVQTRYNQMFWELETFKNGSYKQHAYQNFTSVRRLISWQNAFEVIKAQPLLGTGVGDYNTELQKVYDTDEFDYPMNTHNQYLHFAGSIGIVGLLFFLFILGYWTYFLYQRKGWPLIFGWSFLACYLAIFMTDTVLITQVDNMLFSLFFILIPAIYQE